VVVILHCTSKDLGSNLVVGSDRISKHLALTRLFYVYPMHAFVVFGLY